MIEVNQTTVQEFIKLLIECTNTYVLESDHTIKNKLSGQTIMVPSGTTTKPIKVFYEGAPSGQDVVWLNPFKENAGVCKARNWFYDMICAIGGIITKRVIIQIVTDCVSEKDKNYDEYNIIGKIKSLVDSKTLDELEQINSTRFISIHYNKTTKTAEAETLLLDEDTKSAYPKFRKKTWEALEILFTDIFGSLDLENFQHHAKIVSIPETEAKLQVFILILAALDPYTKSVMNVDLHSEQLQAHMDVLEGYSKLYEWATVNNTEMPKTTSAPPWNQNPMGPYFGYQGSQKPVEYTRNGRVKLSSLTPGSPLMPVQRQYMLGRPQPMNRFGNPGFSGFGGMNQPGGFGSPNVI